MILIVGPNGVGKTQVAYELARRHSGEIINLDRTYLYRHFPLATGLKDALKEKGITRHLYEVLDPLEESYTSEDFVELVVDKNREVQLKKKLSIGEGGSTKYVPALLAPNQKRLAFDCIVGLKFPKDFRIEEKFMSRIEQAMSEGLLEEIAKNLPQYRKSFILSECHAAVPLVSYLDGEINLTEAKSRILKRCLEYQRYQLKFFSQFSEIQWVEATHFVDTCAAVEKVLERTMGVTKQGMGLDS